ncbi:hypothetical protein JCM11641_004232 [Rhodosporidiobolus odoratus]
MLNGWVLLSQQVPIPSGVGGCLLTFFGCLRSFSALGWTYTAAWSLSFWPQFVLNWRRKSVIGLSIDFLTLNPFGFACYSVFNVALFSSSTVRRQYADRHDGHLPQVQWNDLAFALHALVVSSIILLQSFVYKRDGRQRLSSFNRAIVFVFTLSILTLSFLAATTDILTWLDLILLLSYIKLYISFAKYVPQAVINYRRKSTEGWSITNILLDATGGTLSLTQLMLDSWLDNDWRGITGNPGKLGLSFLSLAFDLVFIVQHFVLYPAPDERTPNLVKAEAVRLCSSNLPLGFWQTGFSLTEVFYC